MTYGRMRGPIVHEMLLQHRYADLVFSGQSEAIVQDVDSEHSELFFCPKC